MMGFIDGEHLECRRSFYIEPSHCRQGIRRLGLHHREERRRFIPLGAGASSALRLVALPGDGAVPG
jgi:hypothetical protein